MTLESYCSARSVETFFQIIALFRRVPIQEAQRTKIICKLFLADSWRHDMNVRNSSISEWERHYDKTQEGRKDGTGAYMRANGTVVLPEHRNEVQEEKVLIPGYSLSPMQTRAENCPASNPPALFDARNAEGLEASIGQTLSSKEAFKKYSKRGWWKLFRKRLCSTLSALAMIF